MRYRIHFADFLLSARNDDKAYDLAVNFIDEFPTDFLVVRDVEPICREGKAEARSSGE